ncbi:hypothetical protein [Virgisporangium ochraceum]|uniref:hypothetical protein n=1 Tax=Virgisporangium ochraceum TaxID=65505 RepID=UPI0019429B99|nr:hypothetical protein [Virgisporangium ochraceum]
MATIQRYASVITVLSTHEPSAEVRQSDYDAIVVVGDIGVLDRGLNVIQFGGTTLRDEFKYVDSGTAVFFFIENAAEGLAGKLEVASGLPEQVAKLARESLGPWLLENSPRAILKYHVTRRTGTANTSTLAAVRRDKLSVIQPLVSEFGGRPCAGYWSRDVSSQGGLPQHWWLPEKTPDSGSWIAAIFSVWRELDPVAFPTRADWETDPQWMTKSEIDALTQLEQAEQELDSTTRQLKERVSELRVKLDDLRMATNNLDRRLLSSQGDDLKNETARALAELGFRIVDSDEARIAENSSLLEDLEVHDGTSWVAIAEVRGYGKGAKTSDFQRLARAARGFERRNGRDADARWYIVNHNLSQPPSERRPVLAGAESDVQEFALDNGCVIDTRDLFRLRESVRSGDMDAVAARTLLKECRGIYVHAMYVPDTANPSP